MKNITVAKGVNIFYDLDEQPSSNVLTLKPRFRDSFFKKKTKLLNLLREDPENPIIEEGKANSLHDRDRHGEHFITFDALKLLVNHKIINRSTDSRKYFNNKNILLFSNDMNAFSHALKELKLRDGDDAKFIYVHRIHGVAGYLRNVRGQMHCFVVDSQAYPGKCNQAVLQALVRVFDRDIKIILSSTTQQKDYYSCTTFSYKALLYFVKHGPEVFAYLNKQPLTYDERSHLHILPEDKLMPALLKMSQSKVDLPDAMLDTVVSVKAGLTLRQYWDKFRFQEKYNAAALIKKYGYFTAIHNEMMGLEAGVSNVTKIKR